MTNSFFVTEFNKRQRDLLWNDESTEMKKWFRLLLSQLKFTDLEYDGEIPKKFYSQDFYRLQLGYYGIGKGSGIKSQIKSKKSIKAPSNKSTADHVVGATEVGRVVHEKLIEVNYDIDYMVNEWLYEYLFLWATIKVTKVEHLKDNIIRNKHTIEQKLNLEHYKNVSELV